MTALVKTCATMAAKTVPVIALIPLFAPVGFSQVTESEGAGKTGSVWNQPALSLSQCIEVALKSNPEIAWENWNIQASLTEKKMARGELWPEVHMVGSYSHYLEERMISPRRIGGIDALAFTDDLATGSLVVSVPLFTGGRLRSQVNAAEFLVRSSEQRLMRTKTELIFNVSSVYYSMLGQREVINALVFSRKALEQHHKKSIDLLKTQKAARVDSLRTEVRLADIDQQLLRERNALDIRHFLLASLLGLDEQAPPPEIDGKLLLVKPPADLDKGPATALQTRQDYQSAKSAVDAQREKIRIAQADRLPQVSGRASYGNQWALDSSASNEVGEVGVFVKFPLFDGGRIRAEIARERNRLNAMEETLRKLRLRIRLEVGTATSNIQSTLARVGVTEKAIEQADESLRIEREKYDLGRGAIIDVLDAQSALLTSQMNYYRALADYNTALAEFRLATGANI